MPVEILQVNQDARLITVRHMPQSQRELILAICAYWHDHEMPWCITEVLRFEKPQRIFYSVLWLEGERNEH